MEKGRVERTSSHSSRQQSIQKFNRLRARGQILSHDFCNRTIVGVVLIKARTAAGSRHCDGLRIEWSV
jgi:hypothetical protein